MERGRHVGKSAYKMKTIKKAQVRAKFSPGLITALLYLKPKYFCPAFLLLHVPCLFQLPRPRLQTVFDSLELSARRSRASVMVAKRL